MEFDDRDLYTGLSALHWATISTSDRLIKEEIHTGQTHWYHRNELMWMLELAGFQDVDVKGDWTDETLNSEHEKEMIFVATKNREDDYR